VETLAREFGLSVRQLRRRFETAVGYGPKTLQGVLRFRRFLAHVDAEPAADLARVALDAGYADQAHLARESARLSGLPPAALVRARMRG
jgi:transcriptional regulator GlxA family with amidase domain